MLKAFLYALIFIVLGSATLFAQDDTTYVDTMYVEEPDTTYYYDDADTLYGGDVDVDIEASAGDDSFAPGGGVYFGPTFELTTLSPGGLDPQLDGELVLYGVQMYAIIKGWMLGGHWASATLYDMSTNYDAFEFGYAGFITGYDLNIAGGLSFRIGTLIGGGDLNMIKKRPDLGQIDSTDNEILERYRTESFFLLRPGASLGYSPLPFMDLRLAVDYLYPIGGERVHDLKELTYGLHVMFGFGR